MNPGLSFHSLTRWRPDYRRESGADCKHAQRRADDHPVGQADRFGPARKEQDAGRGGHRDEGPGLGERGQLLWQALVLNR